MPGLPCTAPTERRGVAKVSAQKCDLGRGATESPKQVVRELRACLQLWFLTADPVLGISPRHQTFPIKYSEQVGGRGKREARIWRIYFVILDLSLLKAVEKQDQQPVSAEWKWWEDLAAPSCAQICSRNCSQTLGPLPKVQQNQAVVSQQQAWNEPRDWGIDTFPTAVALWTFNQWSC